MEQGQLIKLTTSPVIEYTGIDGMGKLIENRIKSLNLENQVATEETVKALKVMRAELNKEFKTYEDQRKSIKEAVYKPYADFEAKYSQFIATKYQAADNTLKEKIYSVEDKLKQDKSDRMQEYFMEYAKSAGIDFVAFKQANVNVTLSASDKSLKEQISAFIDDIRKDVEAINVIPEEEDFKNEVLIDYKNSLDVVSAIQGVIERRKAIEKIKQQKEERAKQIIEVNVEPEIAKDTPLQAPTVEETPRMYTTQFAVTGTIEQLKALKQFMIQNNITFKNI